MVLQHYDPTTKLVHMELEASTLGTYTIFFKKSSPDIEIYTNVWSENCVVISSYDVIYIITNN